MKKILYLFMVMAFAVTSYGQVELLNEQFEAGTTYTAVGAPWTLYEYGAPAGDGGIPGFVFDEGDTGVSTTYVVDNDASHAGTIDALSVVHNDDSGANDSWIVSAGLTIPADAISAEFKFQFATRYGPYGATHISYAISDGSGVPADGDFVETEFHASGATQGANDEWIQMTIDISAFAGSTIFVAFNYVDNSGTEFAVDDVQVSYMPAAVAGAAPCQLSCPGDMVKFLDAGECCWPAQYDARTLGDCATDYDTILSAPLNITNFVGAFDVAAFPEWNPDLGNFTADFTANANAGGFTLNGPGSTDVGTGLGIGGIESAINMSNLPASVKLDGRTRFSGPCGVGDNALWNFTMVNFLAPSAGTFTFDYTYHTEDYTGNPVYDPFRYKFNADWSNDVVIVNSGAADQTGSFSLHLNAGQAITFYVLTDDDGCASTVEMSNLVYAGDAITDGIVLASGPAVGDPICHGETQTVKLELLQAGVVIDECVFDITVNEFANPVSSLTCNDNVQISVDGECKATVTADDILEGGPYGCYDNYDVRIYNSMPNPINSPGTVANPVPLGNFVVGVFDAAGNNCWSTITVLDKIPPTIECVCPEGGEFPAGSVVPASIAGAFTSNDLTANLHMSCWDFGTGDQIPDLGDHNYDVYSITVSTTGDYAFTGTDGNKMVIGIFNAPFNAVNACSNMIDGMGGYVLGSSGLFYEEPSSGANLDNVVTLTAGQVYNVVVSDFDAGFEAGYSFSITPPAGAEIYFAKTVYGAECEFAGCFEEGVNYAYALPTVEDNCGATLTWTQTVTDGPYCGTYIVKRVYTATDVSGMTATCTSDYFFKGIDLSNMEWPSNWDGLPEHNPMLECNSGYFVDAKGNPHPAYTGAPSGYNDACGTIEVFYNDQVYNLVCGTKILRTWTVVDDCTGGVYEHIQVIRITDNTAPTFMAQEDLRFKTKAYECNSDFEVPTIMHLADNCDAYPRWYVTTTAGVLVGDDNYNGFVDWNETWTVLNVPMGTYEICYHAIDNCGNTSEACANITVFDGVAPIAVCEQFKQVSITSMGNSKVYAGSFDSGSFDNCNPVHFKVLRVNDALEYDGGCEVLNGDDKLSTPRYQDANDNWKNNEVWYDDDVFFCCDDVDQSVMVSFRVFDVDPGAGPIDPKRYAPDKNDLHGHYNDCWSMVKVECKIPPSLTCPPVYVNCEESLDPEINPSILPQIVSVCGYETSYTDKRDLGVCGAKITRTWAVTGCGRTVKCKQKITVTATDDFDPCTIKFPKDVRADCSKELKDGKEPIWDENPCNVVTAEVIHEDTFTFVDGACYKIVREWAVIDWCVYEANTGAEDNVDVISGTKLNCAALVNDGYYRYTQILMVTDFIPPTISLEDQCIATTDCYAYDVELEASATDSCNVEQKFNWKYIVTNMDTWETVQYSYNYTPQPLTGRKGKRSKDNLDKTTTGEILVLDALPIGNYRVTWTVGDGCGNATSMNQYFEVADKKAPTPIMVDIATAVMESGMVELKARTFDKGGCDFGCLSSVDNCTPKSGLYFTFSDKVPHLWENQLKWAKQWAKYGRYFFNPLNGEISTESAYFAGTADAWLPAQRTSQRVYSCAFSFENNESKTIQVYVFDKFDDSTDKCDDGNFDFANVVVNFNHCDGDVNPLVSGMVTVLGSDETYTGMTMLASGTETRSVNTTDNGYELNLSAGEYTISGSSDENFLQGVTTLDIVLIQKHLLGLKKITDGNKLLAADASGDGSISARDLLEIRKVILGSKGRFTNSSWIAVDENYQTEILKDVQSNISNLDFNAVKIGDVNNDVIDYRSASSMNLMLDDMSMTSGEKVEVPFYAKDFTNVSGAQMTMNLSGVNVEDIKSGSLQVNSSNINVLSDNLVMSWNNATGVSIADGEVLFTLTLRATSDVRLSNSLKITDKVVRSEVYTGSDLSISNISLEYRNADTSYTLYQNEPNPFTEKTVIGFDLAETSAYTLTVYDVTGKTVKVINETGVAGYNTVTLNKEEVNVSGVLYYKLESGDYTATKKMIMIK